MNGKSAQTRKGKSPHLKGSHERERIQHPNVSARGFSNKQNEQYGDEIVEDPNENESRINQFDSNLNDGNEVRQTEKNEKQPSGEESSHSISQKDKSSKSSKNSKNKWKLPKCQPPTITCTSQFDCLKKLAGSCQWFKKLSTKGKAGIITLAIFLTTGIILAAVLIPIFVPPPPEGLFLNPLEYNNTIVYSNVMEGATKDNHRYSAHLTQWKASVSHPTLEAVTRTVRISSNEEEIHCNVPILQIMENFGANHKHQKAYTDWLDHYNFSPQETVEKLIETTKSTLSRPGTYKFGKRIPDNLTLVKVEVGIEIDVEYLPIESKFIASLFDSAVIDPLKMEFDTTDNKNSQNNLKKENKKDVSKKDEKPSNESPSKEETNKVEGRKENSKDTQKQVTPSPDKKPEKSKEEKQNLMAKVMLETVYYIKRVVARNLEVLRAKSVELLSYQKHLVSENAIEQEWQKALVNGCRTVESLRFRCSFEAASVLVPGLTIKKIMGSPDYLVSQTLNLVFKEVKEITE